MTDVFADLNVSVSRFEELYTEFVGQDDSQLDLPMVSDELLKPRRDIVFSIRPQYSKKIEEGRKTVELRRRFPASVPSGTIALIYSTSPIRALTGIAEIEEVVKQSPCHMWSQFSAAACVTRSEFDTYFEGLEIGFAIKLRRARPLRRPLALAELRNRFSFKPPQSFVYAQRPLRTALSYECSDLSY